MSDVPVEIVTVHLRFGRMTELGLYQDTLVFSEDEWAKRDDKAILQAQQDLADTWVKFRSEQLAEEKLMATDEGKKAKIAECEAQIKELQAAIDALNTA